MTTTNAMTESQMMLAAFDDDSQPELLDHIARDSSALIRSMVASSARLLPETFRRLAQDSDVEVRRRVAENDHATPTALDDLARDGDALTRLFVAVNPKTFRTTLQCMRHDEVPGVRDVVAQRFQRPTPRREKAGATPRVSVRRN